MAHTEQVKINGIMTTARVFDQPAQAIDDAVSRALPGGAIDTDLALKAPLASPALTGTPTINGVAAANVGQLCNPNLLDNWYFGNPVDQRGGYVTTNDTMAYSDTGVSTEVGPAYGIYNATPISGTVASFVNVDGITFYCKLSECVRGYTGGGYTIDRWGQPDGHTICLTKEGLVGNEVTDFYQGIEFAPWGEEVTFSVLTANGMVKTTFVLPESVPNEFIVVAGNTEQDVGSLGAYAQSGVHGGFWVSMFIDAGNAIKAAKLELGSQQTLANLDADGNWVLNEIPDYGEQLAKCQRYHINLHKNESLGVIIAGTHVGNISVAAFDIPTPVTMRAKPVITDVVSYGTLVFADGTTKAVGEIIVDCHHTSSVRVFVMDTGLSVFGPVALNDIKFSLSADL